MKRSKPVKIHEPGSEEEERKRTKVILTIVTYLPSSLRTLGKKASSLEMKMYLKSSFNNLRKDTKG